jgi:hypothetical protein
MAAVRLSRAGAEGIGDQGLEIYKIVLMRQAEGGLIGGSSLFWKIFPVSHSLCTPR